MGGEDSDHSLSIPRKAHLREDGTNYYEWSTEVKIVAVSKSLHKILLGVEKEPIRPVRRHPPVIFKSTQETVPAEGEKQEDSSTESTVLDPRLSDELYRWQTELDAYEVKANKLFGLIMKSIDPKLKKVYFNDKYILDPHSLWIELERLYNKQTVASISAHYNAFFTLPCTDSTNLSSFFQEAKFHIKRILASQPLDVQNSSETTFVHALIAKLPPRLDILRMNIFENLNINTSLTVADLESRVFEHERHVSRSKPSANSSERSSSTSKPKDAKTLPSKCQHCSRRHPGLCFEKFPEEKEKYLKRLEEKKKAGEKAKDGKKDEKKDEKKEAKGAELTFGASAILNMDKLNFGSAASRKHTSTNGVIDSGASAVYSPDRSLFVNFEKLDLAVTIADNTEVEVLGKGDLVLDVTMRDGPPQKWTMKGAYYCPSFKSTLIAVSALVKGGKEVRFSEKEGCRIMVDDKVVFQVSEKNGVYPIQLGGGTANLVENSLEENSLVAAKAISWELAHRRLAHTNFKSLAKLPDAVDGLQLAGNKPTLCIPCIEQKSYIKPHPKTSSPSSYERYEKWHIDLQDFRIPSYKDFRYNLLVKDDFTRFSHSYPLQNKNDAFHHVQTLEAQVSRQLGASLKLIQTDSGGDFVNDEFKGWMKEKGIKMRRSVAEAHWENGVVERANRDKSEGAGAMLNSAGVSPRLWPEAVQYQTWIQNRVFTRVRGQYFIPFQKLYGIKPDLSRARIFGCDAYSLKKEKDIKKLEPKTKKLKMVGISDDQLGWKLFDPKTKRFEVRRNVTFDESSGGGNVLRSMGEIQREFLETGGDRSEDERDQVEEETGESTENESSDEEEPVLRKGQRQKSNIHLNPDFVYCALQRGERDIADFDWSYEPKIEVVDKTIPANFKDFSQREGSERSGWIEAMEKEISNFQKHQVFELVDELPKGKKLLRQNWIFTKKSDGRKRARSVILGQYLKKGVDYDSVYAAVLSSDSLKLMFALAANYDLEFEQMDVETAFLHASLKEPVYLAQPLGFIDKKRPHAIWKVKKAVYGLPGSPLAFKEKLDREMNNIGFNRLDTDTCIYFIKNKTTLILICVYVDDFGILSNSKQGIEWVKEKLREKFYLKDGGAVKEILGVKVRRNREKRLIVLEQKEMVKRLVDRAQLPQYSPSTPLSHSDKLPPLPTPDEYTDELMRRMEHKPYREVIGGTLWLARSSRPDILQAVIALSQFSSRPLPEHWAALRRLLAYLKGTWDWEFVLKAGDVELPEQENQMKYGGEGENSDDSGKLNDDDDYPSYPPLLPLPVDFPIDKNATSISKPLQILTYAESSFGDELTQRRPTSGILVLVGGCPVIMISKSISSVMTSTSEAEYAVTATAAQRTMGMLNILKEVGIPYESPATILNDNQSAVKMTTNQQTLTRSRHGDIRWNYIRQQVFRGVFRVLWIATRDMVADVFTKPLPTSLFQDLVGRLGLHPPKWGSVGTGGAVLGTWEE